MPTVTVTFVEATFVLATFVHIRNVSAVTDRILTKCSGTNFLQALTFLIDFFLPKVCLTQIFWDKHFLDFNFFGLKISSDSKFCWAKFFWMKEFWVHKFFVTNKIFLGPKFFSIFFNVKLKSNFTKIYKNEVYHRLGIWHKDLTHHPWDGHPSSQGCSPTISKLFTHHPKDSQPSNSTRSLTLAQPSLFNIIFPVSRSSAKKPMHFQ